MGATCCLTFFDSLEASDWIDFIGIIVNSFLAYWIVRTIQNRLTNKRVLKDYFISEIKDIRTEYNVCLNNLYLDNTKPKGIIPWFKLMNIKIEGLMKEMNRTYGIDSAILNPYQYELRDLITDNADFTNQFSSDNSIIFSEPSKIMFTMFQQRNNQLFTNIIVAINNA